jgi:hypothetical protein
MKEEGKRYFGTRMPIRFRFVNTVLILAILFSLVNAYTLLKMFAEKELFSESDVTYFIFLFIFITAGLFLIALLSFILYYSFGAAARIEKTLERVIKGESSLRISLRKKDLMFPLAEKMNKVIDILEKSIKGSLKEQSLN